MESKTTKTKILTVGDLVQHLKSFDQSTPLKICYDPFEDYISFEKKCIVPDSINDAVVFDITTIVDAHVAALTT